MNINLATQRLIEGGSASTVELTPSLDNFKQISEAVCAFLNTKGGTIIAGLDQSDQKQTYEKVADELRVYLYEQVSPNCVMSVTVDDISQGVALVIDVPNGRDTPYTYNGRVFLRVGKANEIADSQAIRTMVLEKGMDVQRWERRPSPTLNVEDFDSNLISKTVQFAQERRGLRFKNPQNIVSVLEQLELSGFGQFTNAADVVFGRNVALRLPQTRVRAVRYLEDKGSEFIDDQLFEGPALTLLEDILAFIRRHVSVARKFDPNEAQRQDVPHFPFESVNEGVVNALVHRDYSSFSGSVKIGIYPDRLEIWNSGRLPKGLTVKKLEAAKHESILVNSDISHLFYLNELMERVGRGTYKIVRECRSLGMRTPEWKNTNQGVRLTFFSGSHDLRKDLNSRQIKLIESIRPGKEIVTTDYSKSFAQDITARQARRDLEKLEDFGFLERSGSGRGTVFYRTEKLLK
jgi:ATP-dependent DNA helicase RecG